MNDGVLSRDGVESARENDRNQSLRLRFGDIVAFDRWNYRNAVYEPVIGILHSKDESSHYALQVRVVAVDGVQYSEDRWTIIDQLDLRPGSLRCIHLPRISRWRPHDPAEVQP